ncbi:MAG: GIY-YIG nuclease family protein [bacterium]|nr:GIY-YIG nuclease family protein [bacterium]
MPSNNTSQVFFYTYILQSLKDYDNYIGYTPDLRNRFKEHQKGYSFATKSRRPFKLIYYEACLDKDDAKQREKYLKSTAGRRFLAKRLRHFRANNLVWPRK